MRLSFLLYLIVCCPLIAGDLSDKQMRRLGLSKKELVCATSFIKRNGVKGSVFTKKQTHLPCVIERISGDRFVIRAVGKRACIIGFGAHKRVQKAVLYDGRPTIIACCQCDETVEKEIEIVKRLQSSKGIVRYVGDRLQGDVRLLYLQYFSEGCLLQNLGKRFLQKDVVQIARDLVEGLSAVHSLGLLHRDLHEGNVLLSKRKEGGYSAVLSDFGHVLSLEESKGRVAQCQSMKIPPDTLIAPLEALDGYAGEVYSLGMLLYSLAYGKYPSWAGLFDYKKLSQERVLHSEEFARVVELYDQEKREKLRGVEEKEQLGLSLNDYERFQTCLFSMLSPLSRDRPSLDRVRAVLR